MASSNSPRPALLPQGWPEEASEREALTRVLLGAGVDIQRILDTPPTPDAFIRHATRLPFLRTGRECPIIAFAPSAIDLEDLLAYRNLLLTHVSALEDATWLVYLTASQRGGFYRDCQAYGSIFDAGGGVHTWHIHDGILGLVGRETWVAGLGARFDELLSRSAESGIIPIESPAAELVRGSGSTEPAPPDDSEPYFEMPYAAVMSRSLSPLRTDAVDSLRQPSTMPPNPRLRNR